MDLVVALAFAFLAGLVVSGVSASLFELAARQTIRFAAPFVSGRHPLRSLVAVGLAGPLMLGNDALCLYRLRSISGSALALCCSASGLWLGAIGLGAIALASEFAAFPA